MQILASRTSTEPTDHEFGTGHVRFSQATLPHPFQPGGAGHSSHRTKVVAPAPFRNPPPSAEHPETERDPHSQIFFPTNKTTATPNTCYRGSQLYIPHQKLISCQTLVWASFSTQKSCAGCFGPHWQFCRPANVK